MYVLYYDSDVVQLIYTVAVSTATVVEVRTSSTKNKTNIQEYCTDHTVSSSVKNIYYIILL